MNIVEVITWKEALLGGVLIGLSSAFLLVMTGKIAGISGIVGGILRREKGDFSWRVTFVLGLIIGGFVTVIMSPNSTVLASASSPIRLAIAGLIVGIGTSLGSGCTSGHGVCGISRFSKRSIIATLTFMFTGMLTVYLGG